MSNKRSGGLAANPLLQATERQASQTAEQSAVQPARHLDSQIDSRPDSEPERQQRIKATFYLSTRDIVAIDRMQTAEFERTGKKPEKSHLVSRAIQLLASQQDS